MAETIKSKNGSTLELTKTRLTQVSYKKDETVVGLYYLELIDLPLTDTKHVSGYAYSEVRVHLHNVVKGWATHPEVSVNHKAQYIGCCLFSKTAFNKIVKAATAAQKNKRS